MLTLEAKAELHHLALPFTHGLEDLGQALLADDAGDHVVQIGSTLVLDEVAQFGVPVGADGSLEGGGAPGDSAYVLHFMRLDAEPVSYTHLTLPTKRIV